MPDYIHTERHVTGEGVIQEGRVREINGRTWVFARSIWPDGNRIVSAHIILRTKEDMRSDLRNLPNGHFWHNFPEHPEDL